MCSLLVTSTISERELIDVDIRVCSTFIRLRICFLESSKEAKNQTVITVRLWFSEICHVKRLLISQKCQVPQSNLVFVPLKRQVPTHFVLVMLHFNCECSKQKLKKKNILYIYKISVIFIKTVNITQATYSLSNLTVI